MAQNKKNIERSGLQKWSKLVHVQTLGGGGSAVGRWLSMKKGIQADNLAFTECVHKISAFYVDYKCPKSLFCVGSKLCAHGVRGLEAMRIPKRQICVGSKGCAHVVCAYEAMRIPKRDMCAGNKGVGISNTQLNLGEASRADPRSLGQGRMPHYGLLGVI